MAVKSKDLGPNERAAHELLSELRTRIAIQPLPYQHGLEATALESLRKIFDLARSAMKAHPGCTDFARITSNMLNVDLRPFTAKWHPSLEDGSLNSKDGANAFRIELKAVQDKLRLFSKQLHLMAYGTYVKDDVAPAVLSVVKVDELLDEIEFGLEFPGPENFAIADVAKKISDSEAAAIQKRRKNYGISKKLKSNAVGLAFSGGGIRSATFCLGVLQVIAKQGLLEEIDYLSTVSGGGYTGSIVTSALGGDAQIADLSKPYGPDTPVIRHVRQKAKYLSADNLKERWFVVAGTIAGLALNWTALLSFISFLSFLFSFFDPHWIGSLFADGLFWLLPILVLGTLGYGITRRVPGWFKVGEFALGMIAALFAILLALVTVVYGYLLFRDASSFQWSIFGAIGSSIVSLPAVVRFLPIVNQRQVKQRIFRIALLFAGFAVPAILIGSFYFLREFAAMDPIPGLEIWYPIHLVSGQIALLLLCVTTGVFAFIPLNINLTGPHKIYRDRLTGAFVIPNTLVEVPRMSEINRNDKAPYHLINAAVNLPSSVSPTLRERRSDFFLFSKCWTGSQATGYWQTSEWKPDASDLDLGTAMAISGAAASPQMGLATVRPLSSLMTLLNIRLGFWITRPGTPKGTPGFWCLLKEMTGLGMKESDRWLNLSDGGHIENMGVYELLRRRCKFIICVDGEADPLSTFQGKLTLVRHAQIDFGVRIEPRLIELRQDMKSQLSRTHFHLFKVKYPESKGRPEATGLMLYLKLSMTGDEPELLKRYRAINSEFPHQSTLDQFFDEEQFEVYRQLGVHVAEGAFSPAIIGVSKSQLDVSDWFRRLASSLLES
jgi:hypothetical protein